MIDCRHIDGDVCEIIAAEHFMRLGYWVFNPAQGHSPIDLIIVNEDGPTLIQVKKDAGRINPGRNRSARIHRVRSQLQKDLDVQFVYVNVDTREVSITDHDYHASPRGAAANDNEKG
jgi:hypothetical protein